MFSVLKFMLIFIIPGKRNGSDNVDSNDQGNDIIICLMFDFPIISQDDDNVESDVIYFQTPDEIVRAAEALLQTDNPKVKDNVVTEAAVSSACENVLKKGRTNHELYTKLVMSLVEHLESGAL